MYHSTLGSDLAVYEQKVINKQNNTINFNSLFHNQFVVALEVQIVLKTEWKILFHLFNYDVGKAVEYVKTIYFTVTVVLL